MSASEAERIDGSPGNVPFSWEKKAGVSKSKLATLGAEREPKTMMHILPPPPCTTLITENHANTKVCVQDYPIPLPPCAFQPPYYRSSSKKGLWVTQDLQDPFLAAFKECTKTRKTTNKTTKPSGLGFHKTLLSFFSCKRSCAVRDDTHLVRN